MVYKVIDFFFDGVGRVDFVKMCDFEIVCMGVDNICVVPEE